MVLVIHKRHMHLNSTNNVHFYTLNFVSDKWYDLDRIPNTHDITHISIDTIPHGLEKVCVETGSQRLIEVDAAEITPGKNILSGTLPIAGYIARLGFCFNKEHLREQEDFEWKDETVLVKELTDTKIEIYDGSVYHTGYQVITKRIPTGKRLRHITRDVLVWLPEIHIESVKSK